MGWRTGRPLGFVLDDVLAPYLGGPMVEPSAPLMEAYWADRSVVQSEHCSA